MASRHAALVLGILLAASGCRTAGVGNLAREEPAPPRATLTAAELIREHNRTAERIGHDFEQDAPEHGVDSGSRLVH